MFSTSSIAFIKCRNRHHIKNHFYDRRLSLPFYVTEENFQCWYFAWENLQEVFVTLVVVIVVYLTGGFYVSGLLFLASVTPPWLLRPAKDSTSSELYPAYFRLLYFLPGFFVTFLPRLLRFWVGIFYPQALFAFCSFPTFLARFCDSDMGRNTPSRILLCAFPHIVVLSGWRMDLNYAYCGYIAINLSIAPVSHKV